MTLRLRRGTDLQRQGIVLAEGELVYVTDTKEIYAGDGSTLGGIKVTGDVLGSPPRLTQNLDLDGYNIAGIGTVSATAFIGDGSQLTNLPSSGTGILEGQEYRIDIAGSVKASDSTVLVDAVTGSFYGNFIGDGSLISNIDLNQLANVNSSGATDGQALIWNQLANQWIPGSVASGNGITEGSNYRINIVADDSTILVDTATGSINGDGSLLTGISTSQLADTSFFNLQDNDALVWQTDRWVNGRLELDRIVDVDSASAIEGDILYYNGNTWRNIPADAVAPRPQQDYNINIVGNDSTRIVDVFTNNITGNFIGDGSLISNLELNQNTDVNIFQPTEGEILQYIGGNWVNAPGFTEGSNYRINIVGSNSSTIINSDTNTIRGNLVSDQLNYAQGLDIDNDLFGQISVVSLNNTGEAQYLKFTRTDTGTAPNQNIGLIAFDQIDDTGTKTYTSMAFWHSGIYIANSLSGTFAATNYLGFENGNLAIGDFSPEAGYRLDVNGDSIFRGVGSFSDYITPGSYTTIERDALVGVADGSVLFNSTDAGLSFFNGVEWRNVIHSDALEKITVLPGATIIRGITEATRDAYGQDSVDITGAVIYNSTSDRFEFFQAGSWVQLPNNGTSAGQVLTWDGAKWEATAPATGGSVVSADQLDGFDGPYYLDYNNFTNTPTLFDGAFSSLSGVPTTLAGYGIIDAATSAQGALADTALQPADIGSFTFTGTTLDTSDSSGIVVTPAITFSSDVTVQNSLTVTNKITVDTLEVANLITAPTAGTPEISSDGAILLTAATRVEVSSSPLKMASFTTAERDVLSAENGDMIYNTTTNKFQGYANGVWVDLH